MSALNPMWFSVAIAAATAIAAFVGGFVGMRIALARQEEKHTALKDRVADIEETQERHSLSIQDHTLRLGLLERTVDSRPPPADYVRG